MKTNRLVSLLVAGVLLLAPMMSALADTAALSAPGAFPIATEKTKLTILMEQSTYVEDYETNAFTKWIEDTCNVDLDFVLLPATDAADKLSVMISSGQKLPDIINYPLDTTTTYRYAQAGAFLPLNDYYDRCGVNVKKVLEFAPDMFKSITCPDGMIYSVPSYMKELHDEVCNKVWINKNWLEKLNLAMPTTTDELYSVLKAFKENDPNGNGKQDEYPLVGATGWSQDPTVFLMNSFIMDDDTDHLQLQNGKIDAVYNKDAWKEGLLYMRKLVDEKLLDPISFTQDDPQLRAMANNEEACIVGAFAFTSITLLPVATSPYLQDFIGLEPVAGPAGVRLCGYHPATAQNRWFVTADCANPELAFRIGDFLFDPTEEAFLRCRFGIEGKSWSRPPEGSPEQYAGYAPMVSQDVNIWTELQNEHWRAEAPLYMAKAAQGGIGSGDPDSYGQKIADIVVAYQNKYKPADGTYVPTLTFTEDELGKISEIRTTLKTYVKECETRFITRDMSIESDWETYLGELDRIGLNELLTVFQSAYDRLYAVK